MKQLIFACSLSPDSRSAVLARRLAEVEAGLGDEVRLIDLRDIELPFCDGGACYSNPTVIELQGAIAGADAVTVATPIYNYGTGGATRNLIALTGKSWSDKVVGFCCAAGGQGSYMAVMGLANSLMLDFRCLIVPRFVYATGAAFDGGRLVDAEIDRRIDELAHELHRIGSILGAVSKAAD